MKLAYRLEHPKKLKKPVIVSIEAPSPHHGQLVAYEGSPKDVKTAQEVIRYSYGLYGHLIGVASSQLDLMVAMNNMQEFTAILIEGIEPQNDYQFPPDVTT